MWYLAVVSLAVVSAQSVRKLAEHDKLSLIAQNLNGQALVDYVNGLDTTWTATASHRFAEMSDRQIRGQMGLLDLPEEYKNVLHENPFLNDVKYNTEEVPASFQAAEKWTNCTSLRTVRDQSNCGSCWAVAAASAISDRICIHSGEKDQTEVSASDLMGCCHLCGGCSGGLPELAWTFFWLRGIASGGNFGDNSTCRPYPFAPCAHHTNATLYPACTGDLNPTPGCQKTCVDGDLNYRNTIHKGSSMYPIWSGEKAIQREIFKNGPVEAGFWVFADFLAYNGGIYQHKAGAFLGGHAVKIVGWGEEKGVAFWTVANSWNELWGEKGYFRILRGKNHLGIESRIVAGIPRS